MAEIVDLYMAYQFIKRLVTPFNRWKAYKLGIIDENGDQLISRNDFKNQQERNAFTYFDLIALNLKKLLNVLPGGARTIATYAAAMLLLKEHPKTQRESKQLLSNLEVVFEGYLEEAVNRQTINEEGPTVGTAGVAGNPKPFVQQAKDEKEAEERMQSLTKDIMHAIKSDRQKFDRSGRKNPELTRRIMKAVRKHQGD